MSRLDGVGCGWALPGAPSASGGVRLVGGEDEIAASIRMILGTALGERVMRPDFGCGIWDHLFDPLDAATLGAIGRETETALLRWEPRIRLERVEVTPDHTAACAVIVITYEVVATRTSHLVVHPFALAYPSGLS